MDRVSCTTSKCSVPLRQATGLRCPFLLVNKLTQEATLQEYVACDGVCALV